MEEGEEKKEYLLFVVIPKFAGENKEDIRVRKGAIVFFTIERAFREQMERENGRRRRGKGKNWQSILTRWAPEHLFKVGPSGFASYLLENTRGWRVLSVGEIQNMVLEEEVERALKGPPLQAGRHRLWASELVEAEHELRADPVLSGIHGLRSGQPPSQLGLLRDRDASHGEAMSGEVVDGLPPQEPIIYGVFPRMIEPHLYVATAGTRVYHLFQEAWDDFLSPMWGDRAVYEGRADRSDYHGLSDPFLGQTTLLNKPILGWRLMTPDDIVTLNVEKKLGGRPFFNDTQMREDNSWYAQMTRALAKLRYENLPSPHAAANDRVVASAGAITFGELRWVLEFIPSDYAMKIQKTLAALTMQYGKLKSRFDAANRDLANARQERDELRKNLTVLEAGLGKNPRGASPFDGVPAALPHTAPGTNDYWKGLELEAEKEKSRKQAQEVMPPPERPSWGETMKKLIKKEGL